MICGFESRKNPTWLIFDEILAYFRLSPGSMSKDSNRMLIADVTFVEKYYTTRRPAPEYRDARHSRRFTGIWGFVIQEIRSEGVSWILFQIGVVRVLSAPSTYTCS